MQYPEAEAPAWFSPKHTVWRGNRDGDKYKAALRKAVRAGCRANETHVQREILVLRPSGISPRSAPGIWGLIHQVRDREYPLIERHGIRVPEDLDWHVFYNRNADAWQVVARVAIIKGLSLEDNRLASYDRAAASFEQYAYDPAPGIRMADMSPWQCVEGYSCAKATSEPPSAVSSPAIYLVDMDIR